MTDNLMDSFLNLFQKGFLNLQILKKCKKKFFIYKNNINKYIYIIIY